MQYNGQGNYAGFLLFGVAALITGPAFPLLAKFLTNFHPFLLVATTTGYSGLVFVILGELTGSGEREAVYRNYILKPTFYLMTLLKGVAFALFFYALIYLPASLVTMGLVLVPIVILQLRRVYRKRIVETRLTTIVLCAAPGIYLVVFGLSNPFRTLAANPIGLVFLGLYIATLALYQIEKEAAVEETKSWSGSLRLAALHRLLVATSFLPFVGYEFTAPLRALPGFQPASALLALAVAGGAHWFVSLHVTRLLNAYYTSYATIVRTGVVAVGEVILLGTYLSLGQYLGLVPLSALPFILYNDVRKGED